MIWSFRTIRWSFVIYHLLSFFYFFLVLMPLPENEEITTYGMNFLLRHAGIVINLLLLLWFTWKRRKISKPFFVFFHAQILFFSGKYLIQNWDKLILLSVSLYLIFFIIFYYFWNFYLKKALFNHLVESHDKDFHPFMVINMSMQELGNSNVDRDVVLPCNWDEDSCSLIILSGKMPKYSLADIFIEFEGHILQLKAKIVVKNKNLSTIGLSFRLNLDSLQKWSKFYLIVKQRGLVPMES